MAGRLPALVEEEVDIGVFEAAGVHLERGVGRVEGDLARANDGGECGLNLRRDELRARRRGGRLRGWGGRGRELRSGLDGGEGEVVGSGGARVEMCIRDRC